jgi:hypothetical protein
MPACRSASSHNCAWLAALACIVFVFNVVEWDTITTTVGGRWDYYAYQQSAVAMDNVLIFGE